MKRIFKTIEVTIVFLFLILTAKISAQTSPPIYLDSTKPVDARVSDLLSRMTLDEKIGQMMQVDHTGVINNKSDITKYYIGSILSGGDSDIGDNKTNTWADLYDSLQSYALKTPLKIPIIYGIDAVHGNNNIYGATIFPHNIGMGCTRDTDLVKEEGRITAEELAATGIDWTFAPCIAVVRNERWGRTYEGFGETPELAEQMGAAEIRGFQGDTLAGQTSILACAKHYLGDGGTKNGQDQGNTIADEATIRKLFLPGYISAINAGVGSIMASYSSINGEKMHENKYWLTDVLKNELGFKGFVVSDWAAIDQLGSNYEHDVDTSINAGIDMVMLPLRYNDFYSAMKNLVNSGKISMSRVDDAVSRILRIKFELGLFERPYADRSLIDSVGSYNHREVARQCVRESLVLLKRKDSVLPLPKTNARILVAGDHADDIGYQCGGWTISWQGKGGNTTIGTTILQGMKAAAPTDQIDYSVTGDFSNTKADYSVVIIGEKPYAEGMGDRTDLSLQKSDIDLIKKMKSYGNPVVVILITGRPMIIEPILHFSDAIIAAWLPGTEGEGVSDVLFGDYAPKGLLSHTWFRSMDQLPINVGDSVYNPLYPYGYGITSFANSNKGSAPVLMSAIVTDDAKHIELTFNKAMKDPSSLNAKFILTKNQSPFAVNINASLKGNDSTTIILAIDSAYEQTDSVTVSYNSGNIESEDGGALQPFGSFDVYNRASSHTALNIPEKQ
ncbi:MAG: glycoside hydrolase family 3 N-terminal domain-containing protein [Ignavibacteriaceae bacterium]